MDAALNLSPAVASQLKYHLRVVAQLATTGETDRLAAEAALLWGIASATRITEADDGPCEDLPDVPDWSTGAGASRVLRSGAALALDLAGHFASDGRDDLVTLYAGAAEALNAMLATMSVPPGG